MKHPLSLILAAAFVLAACGEKPQTSTARKSDDKPWQGTPSAYAAQDYKGGDQAAWEQQLKNRANAQNEYTRASSR